MEISDAELDFIVRRVIMSAWLYYECNVNVVSDGQYDEWSNIVADNWDRVDPFRKKQMGSPDEIRSSGSHIKHTSLSTDGAMSWYKSLNPDTNFSQISKDRWKFCEDLGCYYINSSV